MEGKVAVITGSNAGVGFSVADRLLADFEQIHVCLACRNRKRAEKARLTLVEKHPGADVSIVIVDTSSIASVFSACKEIKYKFKRLDYLYMNAGIMKVSHINMRKLMGLITGEASKILSTGHGVLVHEDHVTPEGLQELFATNLFGHYVMVRELEDKLTGTGTSLVVWTSSQNADKSALDYNDIQHRNGTEHYSSSKYAMDVLSVALNNRLNEKGVYSVSTCPGLILSAMTYNILPELFWTLVYPFLLFMRLFVASLTYSPHNGAEALVWAAKQKPETLSSRIKYRSNCSIFGKTYVGEEKLHIEDSDADNIYGQLEELYQQFKLKQEEKTAENGFHCNHGSS